MPFFGVSMAVPIQEASQQANGFNASLVESVTALNSSNTKIDQASGSAIGLSGAMIELQPIGDGCMAGWHVGVQESALIAAPSILLGNTPATVASPCRLGLPSFLPSVSPWELSRIWIWQSSIPIVLGIPLTDKLKGPLREALTGRAWRSGPWELAMVPLWGFYPADHGGGGTDTGTDPGGQTSGGTWRIFVRSLYVIETDVELLRLPDNVRIPASNIELSLDADKAHWDFSATVLGQAAIDAIMPGQDGQPVQVQANINGYSWVLYVEDWGAELNGRQRSRRITGRSLSIELSDVYFVQQSYLNNAIATAQQLAYATLPNGWSLSWPAQDWLVPQGAWSIQRMTPIQAVKSLADAVRASVIPSRTARQLTVKPRYPVAPWAFATATPDMIVPGTAATHVSMRQTRQGIANSVFVQGGLVGGVCVKATLTGQAGDKLLPTVQDNLITHVDAARARATGLLAAQWQQPAIRTFAMPLRQGSFPLTEIGQLIEVDLNAIPVNVRGIANSVAISASQQNRKTRVRQTISLGENTPNLWAAWNRNIPVSPFIPGVVSGVNADGSVSVNLRGGGSSVVRQAAGGTPPSAGTHVYIRDGRIDGIVSPIDVVEIEI